LVFFFLLSGRFGAWEVMREVVLEAVASSSYLDVGSCARLGACSRATRRLRALGLLERKGSSLVLDLSTRLSMRERSTFDLEAVIGSANVRGADLIATGISVGRAGALSSRRSLRLTRCKEVDLLSLAPSLRRLALRPLRRLALRQCLTRAAAFGPLPSMPALESLDVSRNGSERRGWTDACLRGIAAACPALTELDVSGSFAPATAAGFDAIATTCRNLRSLRAEGCPRVEWGDAAAVLRRVHQLVVTHAGTSLATADLTADWPSSEGKKKTLDLHLEGLYFGGGRSPAAPYRARRPSSRRVVGREAPREDDVGAPPVGARRSRVRCLAAEGALCTLATSSFRAFLDRVVGPELLVLTLSGFRGRGLVDGLVDGCRTTTNLRQLGVASCDGLSDGALDDVLRRTLPRPDRLVVLDVSRNTDLTAKGVAAAVDATCPNLLVLHASALGPFENDAVRPGDLRVAVQLNGRLRSKARPRCGCATEHTGARCQLRDAYHCATCLLLGTKVLCAHCVRTCHAGHNTYYAGRMNMFCDCLILTPALHGEAAPRRINR